MDQAKKLYYYLPSAKPGEAIAYAPRDLRVGRLQDGAVIDSWDIPQLEIGGFDHATGERTGSGRLTDFLQNDCRWLIVRSRVKELLQSAGVGSRYIQWLDVQLQLGENEVEEDYFVANILDVRAAVHPGKSRYVGPEKTLTKTVLASEAIEGTELFRLKEWPRRVYFSHRLKQLIDAAGLTGVEWGATEVSA